MKDLRYNLRSAGIDRQLKMRLIPCRVYSTIAHNAYDRGGQFLMHYELYAWLGVSHFCDMEWLLCDTPKDVTKKRNNAATLAVNYKRNLFRVVWVNDFSSPLHITPWNLNSWSDNSRENWGSPCACNGSSHWQRAIMLIRSAQESGDLLTRLLSSL